jgi:hypothetical protein
MGAQMSKRLPPPSFQATAPVWAWHQWENSRKRRPDLRSRGHLPTGERGVLIESMAPAADVLLSDFQLWHYALNYWHLPTSSADRREFSGYLKRRGLDYFRDKPVPDRAAHQRILRSWEVIFDIDRALPGYSPARRNKSIQACLWAIPVAWVTSVTRFTGR